MHGALLALVLAATVQPQTLPEVQERLSAEREAAEKLAGREATLLSRLTDLERQIEIEARAVRVAQMRLRSASQRSATAEASAARAQRKLDEATQDMEPRLFARYRLGREGYLRFLLGSRSIADVLRRHRLFNAVLEQDLDAVAILRAAADRAKAARDELAAARKDVSDSAQAETDKRQGLQARVEQQRELLAKVQGERELHEEAVRELEDAERDLTAHLGDIEKTAPAAMVTSEITLKASIRKARGKLLFPAERGRIEQRFGRAKDVRFGTVTIQNGLDVRAPLGTKVLAVWDGKVVHAGWFRGFGNLLIVDHGDSIFSLMAHLGTMSKAVGDAVHTGEEVGTVGDSGSLKGAYLYFELRDGQKPLDPERWLSKTRKGPELLAGAKGSRK